MTSFYLPTLLFLAGLGAYAAVSHGLIGLRKPRNRDHLLLAGMCLACVFYGVLQAASLATQDPLVYVELLRWLQLFFGFAVVLMGLFVESYTGDKRHWVSGGAIAVFLFVVIMAWGTPYTVQFDNPPVLHTMLAPWGEAITVSNPADGRWFKFVSIAVMTLNLGSITILVRHYRRVRNSLTLLMVFAIVLFVVFSSQGLLVRLGVLGETVPLGPLGIAIIPIAMSVALSREMRESDQRLRDILDHVPALVLIKDAQGRYVMINRYTRDFFRRETAQIIGHTDAQLLPADVASMFRANDAQVVAAGRAGEFVEPVDWRGEQRIFLSIKFPLRGDGGKAVAVCVVSTDITQREQVARELARYRTELEVLVGERTRELERKTSDLETAMAHLVHSEKLAALGSLVAGVAHELNTPVGNAYTVVTSLQDELRHFRTGLSAGALRRSELEQFVTYADQAYIIMERNVRRVAELVASFKQVAVDQTSMNRRQVNLAVVVDETLLAISPTYKKVQAELQVAVPDDLVLDTYPGAIEQILSNLVDNAILHAWDGTRALVISVTAQATALNGQPAVLLSVADDGKGMSEAAIKRAFDPFFTTRLGQGGSGLGLYLVHNLVTGVLGGALSLHSTLDQGTRFDMTLPMVAPGGAP